MVLLVNREKMSGSIHIDMIDILDNALSLEEKWKDEGKNGYSKNTVKIEYNEQVLGKRIVGRE
jgi:hypothetical protein